MEKDAIEQGKGGQLLHNMAEMEGRTCLACRLGRRWTVATGDQRPSARGFGVDVGEHTGERERGDVSRSQPQARKRVVLVWCCEVFWQAKAAVKSPL